MVATAIVEEGIHVPLCDMVINFDAPARAAPVTRAAACEAAPAAAAPMQREGAAVGPSAPLLTHAPRFPGRAGHE